MAAQIIAFSELASGLLLAWFGWGFSDEEMLLFPLVLVIVAMLLHWRAYVALAATVLISRRQWGLCWRRKAAPRDTTPW